MIIIYRFELKISDILCHIQNEYDTLDVLDWLMEDIYKYIYIYIVKYDHGVTFRIKHKIYNAKAMTYSALYAM